MATLVAFRSSSAAAFWRVLVSEVASVKAGEASPGPGPPGFPCCEVGCFAFGVTLFFSYDHYFFDTVGHCIKKWGQNAYK